MDTPFFFTGNRLRVEITAPYRIRPPQYGDPDQDALPTGVCSHSDGGLARDRRGNFGVLCYATSKGNSYHSSLIRFMMPGLVFFTGLKIEFDNKCDT